MTPPAQDSSSRRFRLMTWLLAIVMIGLLLALRIQSQKLIARLQAERHVERERSYRGLIQAPPASGRLHEVMAQLDAEKGLVSSALSNEPWSEKTRSKLGRAAARLSGMIELIRDEPGHASAEGDWGAAVDAFAAEAAAFANLVDSARTTPRRAQDSFREVTASCASCHRRF